MLASSNGFYINEVNKMELIKNKKIVLENGSEYYGRGFGSEKDRVIEIVFNTSMVGYQEILSDPSYTDQGVVMCYPLMGNYGMAEDDYETKTPTISALIAREYNDEPSNFRCTKTLAEVMRLYDIVGIENIDTRKLTREIRNYGSCKALITDAIKDKEECLDILKNTVMPTDQVSRVSRKEIEVYEPAVADLRAKFHVVAIDCGMKHNIVRSMNKKGLKVTVVPWDTDAQTIINLKPDGVFISNGPGDPTDVKPVIDTVKKLIGKYPIFGICLGHQILSLAYGAKTYKLKFGHRGGNHPVRNLLKGRVEITSQNHSYAVDTKSIKDTNLIVTHVNLIDQTVEGVMSLKDKTFSVQYHPESAPGPQDSDYLFDEFIKLMEDNQNA